MTTDPEPQPQPSAALPDPRAHARDDRGKGASRHGEDDEIDARELDVGERRHGDPAGQPVRAGTHREIGCREGESCLAGSHRARPSRNPQLRTHPRPRLTPDTPALLHQHMSWRVDATLYVTQEPCPMCAGALVNARLSRLVFGCTNPKAGSIQTLYAIANDPRLNHRVEARGGVRADECAKVLSDFFTELRRGPTFGES